MDLTLDAHLHTIASGHAYSTIKEYADFAGQIGLSLIAITDHSPAMPGVAPEMYFRNLAEFRVTIGGVEILTGVELNILDMEGNIDLPQKLLGRIDVVIASLHSPCFAPGTVAENTKAIVNTMKNPLIRIIGHLGDHRYPFNIQEVVKAAKETDTVIELNNASFPPRSTRGDYETAKEMIYCCKDYEVPVLVSSDSHFFTTTGDFETSRNMLIECDMPECLVLNTSVELFKSTLNIKQ